MSKLSPAQVREALKERFVERIDDDALSECTNICVQYNIDPEDLFWKYEALKFRPGGSQSAMCTMDSAREIKVGIQRDIASSTTKKVSTVASVNLNRNRMKSLWAPPAIKTEILDKPGSIASSNLDNAGPSRVIFTGPKMDTASKKKRGYRYMYEKVNARSERLDDRINEFEELVQKHYNISELGDPSSSTDDEIVVVGRITLDAESSTTSSVKLNEATLTLECSRITAAGARVPLKFDSTFKIVGGPSGFGAVGLFPGAIVALKGKNGGGGWFNVSQVLHLPCPEYAPPAETPSFTMFIAGGPYTPDTDLDYKTWKVLLSDLKAKKPDVLLLTGPFIDVYHPRIQTGDVDSSPATMFEEYFLTGIREYLDASPGSIALIVPSVRDILSDHAVHPQSELDRELSKDLRIHLLPNPGLFSINNVSFAVTSVDVLFHLRKEELIKQCGMGGGEVDSVHSMLPGDTGIDPIGNLCRHILQQRSMYPIFPVPFDVSRDVNLDITHTAGLGVVSPDGYAPDILVLPGRLKQFVKSVGGTTAINSGFTTKGSYCSLTCNGLRGTQQHATAEIIKMEF